MTQDSVTRQQLDIIKTSGMEKLLKDVEQKEQKLQLLTEEAERASKRGQLQQKKMDRELKQVRGAEPDPKGLRSQLSVERLFPGLPPQHYLCSVSAKHTWKWFPVYHPGQMLEQDCSRL